MRRMIPIEGSSNLAGYLWHQWADEPTRGDLEVEFHDGSRWVYAAVPIVVLEGFLLAESKGRYFHRMIRDRYAAMPALGEPGVIER